MGQKETAKFIIGAQQGQNIGMQGYKDTGRRNPPEAEKGF